MTILTKPGSLTKGTPAALSISKSALAALGVVSGDAYFSDTANWSFVRIIYVSSVGNQRHSAKFDCSESTPASTFITSSRARDVFNVESIAIVDFDGGMLSVPASALNAAEFRLDYAAPAPLVWTKFNGLLVDYGVNGGLQSSGTGVRIGGAGAISGDFILTYKIQPVSSTIQMVMGYDTVAVVNTAGIGYNLNLTENTHPGVSSGTAWVQPPHTNGWTSFTFLNTELTITFSRVGGTISCNYNDGGSHNTSLTVQTGNTDPIYPRIQLYHDSGDTGRLNSATKLPPT